MKKQLCNVLVMCSLVVLLGAPLWAQSAGTITANIPFEFVAGKNTLPAGTYTIENEGSFLRIVSADRLHKVVVMPMSVERPQRSGASQLSFTRYGNTYFLSQVWNKQRNNGHLLPRTAQERELAKASSAKVETLIAGQ